MIRLDELSERLQKRIQAEESEDRLQIDVR
jgi:hypothetical protein